MRETELPFTSEQVAAASQCPLGNVESNWPILYKVMEEYGLGDPLNCVGMIGTVAVESASTFKPVAEAYYLNDWDAQVRWYKDASRHAPYSGGWWYYGRGYIQTTHDYNYQKVKDRTGVDVVANPDLLLQAELASHAACIYWEGRNISALCQARDWLAVRRAVYGGNDSAGAARIARVAQVLGV